MILIYNKVYKRELKLYYLKIIIYIWEVVVIYGFIKIILNNNSN